MSNIKVNSINDSSGGNTATINGMTPTAQSLQGFRNRIINGDMRIDQRNAGASVTITTNGTYVVDRWGNLMSQASKYSVQQNSGGVTPPSGFSNYMGVTSLSAYSVLAGDFFYTLQAIEGFNWADVAWGTANAQTVTLSFWVRSSLTGTFGGALRQYSGARSYPFTFSISAANTWEYKTVTVAGDTSGTWVTNNAGALQIIFGFGVGSTYSGPAGSWAAADYRSATGAVSVVGTNGATFYITGVQLEAGSVATPFERRPYGRELMLCQRYYEQSAVPSTYFQAGTFAFSSCLIFYKAQKRATPTVAVSAGGVSGRIEITDSPTYDTAVNIVGYSEMFSATGTSNLFRSKIGFSYTASAEL